MSDLLKGCYGSVICNDPKSTVCQECTLFDGCSKVADVNRNKIGEREIVDISLYKRREYQHKIESNTLQTRSSVITSSTREVLTDYQLSIVNNEKFPRKARKLCGSLFRKGITGKYMINLINSGTNPFKDLKPVILNIASDLLIRGEFSKNTMRQALINRGQSQKTSLSQTHTVIYCLILMSVIDNNLKLRGWHERT